MRKRRKKKRMRTMITVRWKARHISLDHGRLQNMVNALSTTHQNSNNS